MTARPIAVGPHDTVQTAVVVLRTHERLVLPVMRDDAVVGLVEATRLFMYQPDVAVTDVMREPVVLRPDDTLSAAAKTMQSAGLAELPVWDDGLLGFLTGDDLLEAWAIPTDPTTGLPWQDGLRIRAASLLQAGHEITVLFFDMDQFGALNKRWGHIVGDNALKAVATVLRDRVNPETDTPCRFGGDEFVVATTRRRDEALEWAMAVREAVGATPVEGLGEPLRVSVGVAGGLRRAGRADVHGPANLDDLINRASRASTEAKHGSAYPVPEPGRPASVVENTPPQPHNVASSPPTPRPRIRETGVRETDSGAIVTVTLERCGETHTGTAQAGPEGLARAAAAAAAAALDQSLPASFSLTLTAAAENDVAEGYRVVVAGVTLDGPLGRQDLVGVAIVGTDALRAAVKAVLHAANRVLEILDRPGPVDARLPRASRN
jgi:diguanylate cyclase (GGDEF)-like protein